MNIDWNHFTPIAALVGGALIGLGAAILLLVNGRILGISGILGSLLKLSFFDRTQGIAARQELAWRIFFVVGMISAPLLYHVLHGLPGITLSASPLVLGVAGLLVGFGTRYGAGCTSGHGVCGLSRLSKRSLVATLCFMGSGFATTYVWRHVYSSL